jgi:hypothetical protein
LLGDRKATAILPVDSTNGDVEYSPVDDVGLFGIFVRFFL